MNRLRRLVAKQKRTVKVSWLGLDRAGKTTILTRVTQGVFQEDTVRTLGMNVDEFRSGDVSFVSWDIGGQVSFRSTLWESYMSGSMGVIYVVDSADHERFDEARTELWTYVIDNEKVENIPILILANKQDLENAGSAGEVARALDLHKVTKHSYAIMPTSAKTGFNIEEALEWLRQRITEKIE
ncbi:MAG: ADP-ribosylation factor family protein [Candidatus Hodarchaeales archaeon]